ncbi:MAG: ComEC/Rec2 family competence protein [Chloroflexota bacterium]
MTLVYLAVAWLVGVFLGLAYPGLARLVPLAAVAGVALAFLWWRRLPVRTVCLCGVVAAFAVWRAAASGAALPGDHVSHLNGQSVTLRGSVQAEPRLQRASQRLRLAVDEVEGAEGKARTGTVEVTTARYPAYRYGDRLEVSGQLATPADFEGFAYREYLARQGIYSQMPFPSTRLLARQPPADGWALLSAARKAAASRIAGLLPEPQASLAAALLLGERGNLPDDLVDAFRVAGVSHVLAVSGWQVTLVAALLGGLCARSRIGRGTLTTALTTTAIVAYVLLVGASPAVVRAGVMGGVSLLSTQLGRPRDGLNALAIACLAMTAVEPGVIFDLGFQLSATATLGLVSLSPALLRWGARLPDWLWPVTANTLAAQVMVLPVLLASFGQLSVVGLAANLLVVPLVPGAMEWSAFGVVLSALWQPLGSLAADVSWLYLSLLVWVVTLAAALPFAAVTLGEPHPALVLGYYAALALGLDGGRRTRALWGRLAPALPVLPRGRLLALAAAVVVLLASTLALRVDDSLRLSVLDVGQGDAILLRTPAGRYVLVDGGPDGVAVQNALGKRLPYGDKTLDLVVLTHPHDDHLVGLIDVVQNYRVRQVLEGPSPARPTPAYKRWRELLDTLGVPTMAARTGQSIDLGGGAALRVRHAGEAWGGDDAFANDASVVLSVERGGFSALLLGDAGPPVQRWLMDGNSVEATTVVKVPHHGSSAAFADGFLSLAAPREAVVSVGASNRFGHPSASTLALLRSASVHRTDLDGTVEIEVGREGYRVSTTR